MKNLAVLVVLLTLASSSGAAIYKCIDKNGTTSYSSIPCPTKKITGNSEVHKLWKELRQYSVRGAQISQTVGADVDSIKACRVKSKEYLADLQTLKEAVDKLDKKYADMRSAYESLQDCGICLARGAGYCSRANGFLDSAKNALIKVPERKPPPWARKLPNNN